MAMKKDMISDISNLQSDLELSNVYLSDKIHDGRQCIDPCLPGLERKYWAVGKLIKALREARRELDIAACEIEKAEKESKKRSKHEEED